MQEICIKNNSPTIIKKKIFLTISFLQNLLCINIKNIYGEGYFYLHGYKDIHEQNLSLFLM